MRSTKLVCRASGMVLLLPVVGAALAWFALPVSAQTGGDDSEVPGIIDFEDGTDDVLQAPGGPPSPALARSGGLDITRVRVFGETGEHLLVSVQVRDLAMEKDYPKVVSSGIDLTICFQVGEAAYGARTWYTVDPVPAIAGTSAKLGLFESPCGTPGAAFKAVVDTPSPFLDAAASTFLFKLPRFNLGVVPGGRPLQAGEEVGQVWVETQDHNAKTRVRYDAAPDHEPDASLLRMAYPLANQGLNVRPDAVGSFVMGCGVSRNLPTYVIEAGGKRSVPFLVTNELGEGIETRFSVRTLDGAEWSPAVLAGLPVPAGTVEEPGQLSVSVIVQTALETHHKDCTVLLFRAVSEADPLLAGEAAVVVVAAEPPTPAANTFHLHAAPGAVNPCASDRFWMSVPENDAAADPDAEVFLNMCDTTRGFGSSAGLASTDVAFVGFPLDLNPNRDLVLNTTITGKDGQVKLRFRSDGPPTLANIHVSIISFSRAPPRANVSSPPPYQVLAWGDASAQLGSQPVEVTMPLRVRITREVEPHGDPSRLVPASERLALGIRYEPAPLNVNTQDVRPAGQVRLLPEGSFVQVPIWESLKNRANDPGAGGSLFTLGLQTPNELFANPDRQRLFNFTLLNEGVGTDIAHLAVHGFGKTDRWEYRVEPAGPFTLAPGESQRFVLEVTPRDSVDESDRLRLEVTASSQADAEALSTMTVWVTATRGDRQPDERPDDGGHGDEADESLLPAPSVPALAAAAGIAALRIRARSRREPAGAADRRR